MERALWGRPYFVPFTASRILGMHDAKAWRGLLTTLHDSGLALPAEQMLPSLDASDEAIRLQSLRYLVTSYAADPSKVSELVRTNLLAARTEKASDEEDFARELLRRMFGAEKKESPRWTDQGIHRN